MPRHSFDTHADGIELSSETLIYSYFPDAATPPEALARLAASSSRSYLRPGMEFRASRQRPNTALWDVEEVGKIWYLDMYQGYVAFTLDAATAAAVQETGTVHFGDDHVQYVPIPFK